MKRIVVPLFAAAALSYGSLGAQPPTTGPTTQRADRPRDNTDTTVGRVQAGAMARRFLELHKQYSDRAKQGDIDVVFLGDSITQILVRDNSALWKTRYEPMKAVNFGIMGNVIQHVLWRVENGELDGIAPKVVVLLIGTNNSDRRDPKPIVTGIEHLIGVIQHKCPTAKVLLMAIFPRDKPNDANAMRIINLVNPELAKLDNGNSVRFLNINDRFLNADGSLKAELFTDRLHPSPAGYQVWSDAMQPLLQDMLHQ